MEGKQTTTKHSHHVVNKYHIKPCRHVVLQKSEHQSPARVGQSESNNSSIFQLMAHMRQTTSSFILFCSLAGQVIPVSEHLCPKV